MSCEFYSLHKGSFKVCLSKYVGFTCKIILYCIYKVGAQWLSGRVHDSRPRSRGFEPHRRHCVVVLEQATFTLA